MTFRFVQEEVFVIAQIIACVQVLDGPVQSVKYQSAMELQIALPWYVLVMVSVTQVTFVSVILNGKELIANKVSIFRMSLMFASVRMRLSLRFAVLMETVLVPICVLVLQGMVVLNVTSRIVVLICHLIHWYAQAKARV